MKTPIEKKILKEIITRETDVQCDECGVLMYKSTVDENDCERIVKTYDGGVGILENYTIYYDQRGPNMSQPLRTTRTVSSEHRQKDLCLKCFNDKMNELHKILNSFYV